MRSRVREEVPDSMIDCGLVAQAIAEYDPDAHEASIVKAGEQREEFLGLFSKEGWPAMTLDRYALGQADHPDNFCRWMEFVTTELGSMKGGSARKHLIYFQAAAGEWWFDRKLYGSVEEAWQAVHQGFLTALELAETGRWAEIEQIAALRSGPALVNKMLSAYFPDEILPINSQSHLRHFLRELGDGQADDHDLGTTSLNRRLLEGLRACRSSTDGQRSRWSGFSIRGGSVHSLPRLRVGRLVMWRPSSPERSRRLATTAWRCAAKRRTRSRKLLDDAAGRMTEPEARSLLKLFNADFNKGRRVDVRFSPAFVGHTANVLVGNLDDLNEWTGRL